jgi:NADH-quinone oxidoreductase subunit N
MDVTWLFLAPQIIVAVTGALILIADLIWPAPPSTAENPGTGRPALAWLGIAGLTVSGVVLATQIAGIGGTGRTLLSDIIVVDELSVFFGFLFLAIGILVLLMSMEAVPKFSRWTAEFYALVVWCTLGNMLLASANELFTIFLCLQLTSLPLIVLIGFAKRDPKSGEASLKYLLLVLVSTAVLLYGMSLIYGSLGTSTLPEIGERLAGTTVTPVLALGLVLLLTGFAFKITAAPFHWWVPDAYEGAPTPVTAFMSVGSKFAGFALALRIIVTGLKVPLDWSLIFGVMAALSMFVGNLGAIRQTNIKRMLAYSGIAQAGYLLVGVAALSDAGISAVLFYAIAYTLANLAAFGAVIIVANSTGSTEIEDYAGLARRSPLIALSLAVALLSLGGLPLMAGFMAKFYVFLSAVDSGLLWLVAIGVLNSVISLYYYLRVVYVMYVREAETHEPLRIDRLSAAAISFCIAGVLVLGILPDTMMRAAARAAASLFGG